MSKQRRGAAVKWHLFSVYLFANDKSLRHIAVSSKTTESQSISPEGSSSRPELRRGDRSGQSGALNRSSGAVRAPQTDEETSQKCKSLAAGTKPMAIFKRGQLPYIIGQIPRFASAGRTRLRSPSDDC